jgi:hypothetical protein
LHRDEIPPGTLYLLILKTLSGSGGMHGYEIANGMQRSSDDVLQVEEGSQSRATTNAREGLGEGVLGHNRRESAGALLPIDCTGW